jgi:uncharacterized membrane protein YcaP (DUF421 family)
MKNREDEALDFLFRVDWGRMFTPDTPPLEIFVRGSVMYLGILALLRIVRRREASTIGVTDLLVVVLLADAAQNGMAGDYQSIPDGLLLVGTLMGWSYALEWLGYHFPAIQRLLEPPPLPLIRNGKLLRRNLRQELITEEELRSQLRQQGVEDFSQVKLSYIEPDGGISVVTYDQKQHKPEDPPVG